MLQVASFLVCGFIEINDSNRKLEINNTRIVILTRQKLPIFLQSPNKLANLSRKSKNRSNGIICDLSET